MSLCGSPSRREYSQRSLLGGYDYSCRGLNAPSQSFRGEYPMSECYACGRIYLAILKNGGVASIDEIVALTVYSSKTARRHLRHLLDSGDVEAVPNGPRWM